MRILIATDAWHPQVNGVVRTLERTGEALSELGVTVGFLTPLGRRSLPMPSYPEIRLSLVGSRSIGAEIDAFAPDHVHIATEGPIGIAARRASMRRNLVFTTSYHTRFPEYLRARAPVPTALTYAWLRRFHGASNGTMVATKSLAAELGDRGFRNIMPWNRGVDAERFSPELRTELDLPRPIFLYVGRVAVEKNIEAFLALDLPGSKLVVGDGPARKELEGRFPAAHFVGVRTGEDLARTYASSDVFVFPSRTDTFGIVLLEALASGLPVAAYPVTGPSDVIGGTGAGVLDEDLHAACLGALELPRERAREVALGHSWQSCAESFLANVEESQWRCGRRIKLLRRKAPTALRNPAPRSPAS